jgi:hypothetical protein
VNIYGGARPGQGKNNTAESSKFSEENGLVAPDSLTADEYVAQAAPEGALVYVGLVMYS